MNFDQYTNRYKRLLNELTSTQSEEKAMQQYVGGEFDKYCRLETDMLKVLGLSPKHDICDVGCGSGRLAYGLKDYLEGKYIGFDILEDVTRYARDFVGRSDWRFDVINSCSLPMSDQSVDFVTFFSVFTHISPQDCYRYLKESFRVLRTEGLIVISFLDYAEPWHFPVFQLSVDKGDEDIHINFLTRDSFEFWARYVGYEIKHYYRGSLPWIPVQSSIAGNPAIVEFGQSVIVLKKPATA